MEVEVADEVEGHLLPPPCLLRGSRHFGKALHIVHGVSCNEILRACISYFFVFEKLSLTKFGVSMCKL